VKPFEIEKSEENRRFLTETKRYEKRYTIASLLCRAKTPPF